MLGLLVSSCPLYAVFDTLYEIDLSGNNQTVELGKEFKPLRLKTLPGCEVEFLYIGDTVLVKRVLADAEGYVIFQPPKAKRDGDVKVLAKTSEAHYQFNLKVLPENYWFFWILEFFAGFVFFVFGLNRGSSGIMRAIGGWTRAVLTKLSANRLLALLGGIIGALGFQSSTAVTVMVVSLTDIGILSPPSALVMNAGAGIGTTITVGILALGLTYVSIILMVLGYVFERFFPSYQHYGRAIFGFGMAFFGIWFMGNTFSKVSDIPTFISFLRDISGNTILMFLFSTIFAALVHSSALTIGIGLSMAFAGILGFEGALSIVLGANVGTAFTAVLASSSLSGIARKVALINLFGRFVLSLILLYLIPFAKSLPVWVDDTVKDIALSHIYYNLMFAILIFPVSFVRRLWVYKAGDEMGVFSGVFLEDPNIIIAYMEKITTDALNIAIKMFQEVPSIIRSKSPSSIISFQKLDDEIDDLEQRTNALITKALSHDIPGEMANKIVTLAYVMEEIENAGDIMSKSIARLVEKMYREGINLTESELEGIHLMHREVMKTFADALVILTNWDREGGKNLYNRRDEVKTLLDELRKKFYSSGVGVASLESGEVYLDILSDMERVNFHIASIGGAIYEYFSG
ncbi:MAG: Na/Pi cotransporter family protein [candidate division WOR-3 bacterium]